MSFWSVDGGTFWAVDSSMMVPNFSKGAPKSVKHKLTHGGKIPCFTVSREMNNTLSVKHFDGWPLDPKGHTNTHTHTECECEYTSAII